MTVRTVISGAGSAAEAGAGLDAAAGVLNGYEGVALDPQAEAEIAAALEACAARARALDAAYEQGGEAAADAGEDDLESPFFRSELWHGALEPPIQLEDREGFVAGEDHWTDAGAEKPAELVALEERLALERAQRARLLAPPTREEDDAAAPGAGPGVYKAKEEGSCASSAGSAQEVSPAPCSPSPRPRRPRASTARGREGRTK